MNVVNSYWSNLKGRYIKGALHSCARKYANKITGIFVY